MSKLLWSDKHCLVYNSLKPNDSSSIKVIYPSLKTLGIFKPNMSILSIGAGTGFLESQLVKDFNAQFDYLDPSPVMFEIFQKHLQEQQLNHRNIECHSTTFEEFKSKKTFDLVISVHSWHYIGYQLSHFHKALDLLNKDGIFCIVLTSQKAFTHPLKSLLYPSQNPFINYEEISEWATHQGFSHDVYSFNKFIPTSKFIEDDHLTEYGRNWLSYLGRKESSEISPELETKAIKIISTYDHENTLDDAWGVLVFHSS